MNDVPVEVGQIWKAKSWPEAFIVVWRNKRYVIGVDANRADVALPQWYSIKDFKYYTQVVGGDKEGPQSESDLSGTDE